MVEHLNRQLKQCNNKRIKPINRAAISIATDGVDARLYVSWKHDELNYYMAKVKCFRIQEPEQYMSFCKYIQNILDRGRGKRLKEIRNALDILHGENRKMAS